MTVYEALESANIMRPNAVNQTLLAEFLMKGLEGDVAEMMGLEPPINQYPSDMELLMPHPYNNIYALYLAAQIDLLNEETILYENDMAVFNKEWDRAQAWWRRNNRKRSGNWKVM